MLINREDYANINPAVEEDRRKYAGAVIDEIKSTRQELVGQDGYVASLELYIRPVVQFRWNSDGWVKRLVMQPFAD
jgi:hypothetical protein